MHSAIVRLLTMFASVCAIHGGHAYAVLVTIPFDTVGSAAAQTAPFGISLFVSNSFTDTQGISGAFTGNLAAPIGPPRALSLGGTPGAAAYFHFSPLPGYEIHAIGISATGAFADQSTTFHVFAANTNLEVLDFDATMTPTASGIAGLNGGALFLNAVSPLFPITAFRVWQIDDGFGVLDNLVADVTAVPEGTAFLAISLVGLLYGTTIAARRWIMSRGPGQNSC